jgi:hypothetical protein
MEPSSGRAYANVLRIGSPLIAWALIVAILVGGLPILTGVVVMADSKPAFAVDVCHPLGGASYNLDQSEAPLVPTHTTAQLSAESGAAPEFVSAFSPRVSKAPDPPPPKIG